MIAGGLLYVYDPGGGLRIYSPETGRQIARLECGSGHWNSPIVADGRVALPEGMQTSTTLAECSIFGACRETLGDGLVRVPDRYVSSRLRVHVWLPQQACD